MEPGRLVTAGWRWYLVGYDNDQDDWRTFRVDRITEPVPTGQRFTARLPAGGGEQDGRLTSPPDTVEWLAARLIRLGCEFEVHSPPDLIDYLSELAARVARAIR